jgi:GNAT superfamily N-acetyltransferase
MQLPIRTGSPAEAEWIESFLRGRWGATTIVVRGEVIDAAGLPALIVMAEERRGLATYRRLGPDAELVTLDADPTGVGTGAALIEALAAQLRADGCERLWLTTTSRRGGHSTTELPSWGQEANPKPVKPKVRCPPSWPDPGGIGPWLEWGKPRHSSRWHLTAGKRRRTNPLAREGARVAVGAFSTR